MPAVDIQIIIGVVLSAAAIIGWIAWAKGGGGSSNIDALMQQGLLHKQQNNFVEAEISLERALKLLEGANKPDISRTVTCMVNLAQCYEKNNKFKESRDLFQTVFRHWESLLRSNSAGALIDIDYAVTNSDFGKGTGAVEQFYERVVDYKEKALGQLHPDVTNSLIILAQLKRKTGKNTEAAHLDEMIKGLEQKRATLKARQK